MEKDLYIEKYCKGKGIEIGGADNCVKGVDTIKTDVVTDYMSREYNVDHILDAHELCHFNSNTFDFLITIHVLEHLTNPVKALIEWHRVVKNKGYIFAAIPKRNKTFDRYRDPTTIRHLLEDFHYDVGRMDTTHIIEFNQFSVPGIYLDWKHKLVPDEKTVDEISRFYRGEKDLLNSDTIYNLWRHLESEKQRHLNLVRKGIPLDLHFHVWEDGKHVYELLKSICLTPVEIVEDYLGNSILFVVQVEKNPEFDRHICKLKEDISNFPKN